jgi:hypothetical protein
MEDVRDVDVEHLKPGAVIVESHERTDYPFKPLMVGGTVLSVKEDFGHYYRVAYRAAYYDKYMHVLVGTMFKVR